MQCDLKVLSEILSNYTRLSYNSRLQVLKLVFLPSQIHDGHQPWLHNAIRAWTLEGLLLPQEADGLEVLTGMS